MNFVLKIRQLKGKMENTHTQKRRRRRHIVYTVQAEIFAVVLFSRNSRVKLSRKFPLQFMSIYSNDNISKIAMLTTRELSHLAKTVKIMAYTVYINPYAKYSRNTLGLHLYYIFVSMFIYPN